MLRVLRTSPTIRSAIIIAASVALILPLPARCLSCSAGTVDCTHCQTDTASTQQPEKHSCCDHHAAANHASNASCNSHAQSQPCGCKLQSRDRTYITTDRQALSVDLVAIVPSVQPLVAIDFSQSQTSAPSHGDLPPPVPHRILHCSWII